MSLSPGLSVCFKENNTVLQITDTTGAYASGNTGGYGTPNHASTAVTSAKILITFPNGGTQLVDVTSQISAGVVTGNYVFTDITPTSTADGVWNFTYQVISGSIASSETTSVSVDKLFLGKVRCCLDKLWKDVPKKMCAECETDAFIDRVLTAEGYYKSLLAMGGCYQLDSITKVLTQLQTLCDFEDCNC